jgi:uncharacterized protein (TIGR02217 family)
VSSINIVGFDEIRMPDLIEFGVTGGPGWNTGVVKMPSGFEQRNQNRADALYEFVAEHRVHPGDDTDGFGDFAELLDFFNSRRGKLRGFRFKDWTDYEATAEVCVQYNDITTAVGDGVETEFQTAKNYDDGVNPWRRLIKKPVIETGAQSDDDDPDAQVFLDTGGGPVLQTRTTDYTFDTTSGKITFVVAPAVGDVVTWTGRFDVPVRFDIDRMDAVLESFSNFEWPSILIVGVKIPQ